MPRTHVRSFRVRYYECDAYGHVNNANYARYMQEAAFDASAAAGYDLARYEQMHRLWIVRETEIEYLSPLAYNDTFEVKTWVANFQRVHSVRRYELRRGGELVARGHMDWAFMDTDTGRLAAIPPEMRPAFLPEDDPEPVVPRKPKAELLEPAEIFRWRKRVEWQHIDTAQRVNNAVFLNYAEECGWQAVAHFGWPVTRMRAEGLGIFVARNRVVYHQPAVMDDEIEIATWVSDVKRTHSVRHYFVTRVADGAALAEVHSQGVWVDLRSGRPVRAPQPVLDDFRANIAGPS